ncbi:LptF/LptG family permease [Candidatus Pelagibacter sp.]|nr:LptF/LptG family permease [Candidatus Pelagibacter sp.]
MILKTYQKYLIKEFLFFILKVTFVFFVLGFIMGILEELKFFSDIETEFYFPFFLVFLNVPSLIYQIFPFIILISVIFLFQSLGEKGELISFKNNGLDNFAIIKLLSLVSLSIGILVITIFYNFAAVLKFNYLDIKKDFTTDAKYLAAITENGLWIKDEVDNDIVFVNAEKIEFNSLINVEIIKLNQNFEYQSTVKAKKFNIKDNLWTAKNVTLINNDNSRLLKDEIEISTSFDFEKISNLYSDLSSITFWGLIKLKKDYKTVNYSTTEIDYQFQKILSYPIYLTIMALFSIVLMMNLSTQINKIFLIAISIFISVLIYYINHFFGIIGRNETVPLLISIWIPLLILLIISTIGLVKVNDK